MRSVLLFVLAMILLAPFAVWALYKPVRVLAPSWVSGVSCVGVNICIDDKSKYPEALKLYEGAIKSVAAEVGPFQTKPVAVFCSTPSCFHAFGFHKSAADNVGKSAIVIGPRGWKPYYLRHELIHHRQAEEFGLMGGLLKPEWLTEGMAYSLSHDPRTLSGRWQRERAKFESWLKRVGQDNLWKAAKSQ